MKELIIVGAGDFGREIANVVERINALSAEKEWELLGFVDDDPGLQNTSIDGYPVIGEIEMLNSLRKETYAICSLGVSSVRKKVLGKITNTNIKYAALIDPDARVYRDSTVGQGSIICGGSILAINTHVGDHVIVNLNCTLGHDVVVEDYSVVNPGVNISGKVIVRECCDIGTGAKAIQGLSIGPNTTIGAGGVVLKNVPADCVAVGVPVKVVKSR